MFNSENIIQRNLKHLSGKSIRLCAVATVLFGDVSIEYVHTKCWWKCKNGMCDTLFK